jgi:peptidyl-prolyl cis-trans isomerase C
MIDAEIQYHPAADLAEARRKAARALVVRCLLLDEATRLGLRSDDTEADVAAETPEERLIGKLVEHEVRVPQPDEDSCYRYYRNNLGRFTSPDVYEAAHILLPAALADAQLRAAAKTTAQRTLEEVLKNPERFAVLAKERSACPSKEWGGSLGLITRGDTVPELETFLNSIDPGQICPVLVPTRFGYHILRVDRREKGRTLPFDRVKERIADYLRERSWSRAVHQYVKVLAGRAKISGIDLDAASTPLVQ